MEFAVPDLVTVLGTSAPTWSRQQKKRATVGLLTESGCAQAGAPVDRVDRQLLRGILAACVLGGLAVDDLLDLAAVDVEVSGY